MSRPVMLEKSIIVSAHPDDEVLWFSSILEKVDTVLICFLNNETHPKYNAGRRKSLEEYPIKNISCFHMDEAGVLNGANWKRPVATEYGLEIVQDHIPLQRIQKYKDNYRELVQRLEQQLRGYRNVFTHNPWGEYGHEEHVQVHRAVTWLQKKLGFHFWYSNYVAEKSFRMMTAHRERLRCESVTLGTNRTLAHEIKEIYKRNDCWTWHDNWEWLPKESFVRELTVAEAKTRSRPFPTNRIRVTPPPSFYSLVKQALNRVSTEITRSLGFEISRRRREPWDRVVRLQPDRPPNGTVLLSWDVTPFGEASRLPGATVPPIDKDCVRVARAFLDLGFSVEVVDVRNRAFHPRKPYVMFAGHRMNFDRLAGELPKTCIKIACLDTAHWVFHNQATYRRQFELQQRKGVTVAGSQCLIEPDLAIEHADYAVIYGNNWTMDTYRYAKVPLFCVPRFTGAALNRPEEKDPNACRRRYLWLADQGIVHRGLDLALDAFAAMPEYELYVCGPIEREKEFVKAYYRELYRTANIHPIGSVDVMGAGFQEIANRCIGIVFPSCSEAQAVPVITAMHAGLLPLVSEEAGIDVDEYGVVFANHDVTTIQEAVRRVSGLSTDCLREMARKAWGHARENHTSEHFSRVFKQIVLGIMEKHREGNGSHPGRGDCGSSGFQVKA